jgi:hypothetical protein
MIASIAQPLVLNAVLIVIVLYMLDRREARWAPRSARCEAPRLRSVRRPRPALHEATGHGAESARRKAS